MVFWPGVVEEDGPFALLREPLRPFADEQGPEVVARLRAEFVRRAPAGAWTHRPSARNIVAVRDRESP